MLEVRALFDRPHRSQRIAASPRHVLLVDRATIRDFDLHDHDLRADIVVEGDLAAATSGSRVTLGDLALRITIPCESCAVLDRVRPGLARQVAGRRGVLARVVRDGRIAIGDRGTVIAGQFAPIEPDWRARVRSLAAIVPVDRVISYADLATLAGVQPVYCRAFAKLLREFPRALPEAKVRGLARWTGDDHYTRDEV